MAQKFQWMQRPIWQSVVIVCSLLVWCLYLAFCWISSLPLLAQALLGLAVGITSMASYSTTQNQRSHHRQRTSVHLAQLSVADMSALQRLLPNHDRALSWLPDASDVELVRWINAGFEKAWPFFKEASTGLIKVQLEAVFNKYRSGSIQEVQVGKINLGNNCPYIQGVKASPMDEDNKICLEIQLDWRQNEDQEILLHVLTSGPEYVVQVKHFVIYCVMRLTFTPLLEDLPCFAALIISIIERPLIDFQTRFIGGDGKKMPEMQKAVDNILVAALMDLLVWPGRVVVPLLPGDYSGLEASCVGHLYVQLLEAKDLANKDIVGRSDPYVVLFVRWRKDLIKESSQMHDTSEPVWNEQFLFNVEDSTVQKLTMKVMNPGETNSDVLVGTTELAINQLEANTQEDLWIDLVGDPSRLHGKSAGKIHLLVEFKPLNLNYAETDSSSKASGESLHSTAPLAQSIGGRNLTKVNNTVEGLRAVLEGQGIIGDNNAPRPISFRDVVAPSSKDLPVLGRAQVTAAGTEFDSGKLADYDECPPCQKDKTESAYRIDDGITNPASRNSVVIAGSPLPEGESSEKRVDDFGTTECEQGIGSESQKESEQTSRDFSEGFSVSNTEKRPNGQVIENETECEVDMDNTVKTKHNIIAGDPAWGLNGLPIEHCNSSIIHEDMFSTEIFEVD